MCIQCLTCGDNLDPLATSYMSSFCCQGVQQIFHNLNLKGAERVHHREGPCWALLDRLSRKAGGASQNRLSMSVNPASIFHTHPIKTPELEWAGSHRI